jgi:transcriptional regulator with XRE-family HTH domain
MRLVELMKKKGYSFTDLAEASGVSRSTVEKVAYGKAKLPHPKTKRLIAKVFEVEIEEIDEFKEPGLDPES